VTTAESTTDVLGAVPSEQDVDFNGTVILRAAPQPGLLEPTHALDGIHGVGHSDVISPGGTGVVGFGGLRQGTGLVNSTRRGRRKCVSSRNDCNSAYPIRSR
jgi:hypothetical protein